MMRNFGLLAFAAFALAALVYLQLSPMKSDGDKPTSSSADHTPSSPSNKAAFDFYVLALSWSPSFCASSGKDKGQQCGTTKNFGFIVHGLWPQFERGYPEFCRSAEPDRVPDHIGKSLFDIMPSMGLIGHQWRKHGSCSGLTQKDYFALTRSAYNAVVIPPNYRNVQASINQSPQVVEQQFLNSNQGLKADQIAVTCADGMIEEVRICFNPDLSFRSCPEVNQKACRANSAKLPAQ